MSASNFSIFLGFWICLIFNKTCTCAWFLFGISHHEWFLVVENTSCCMHIWELNLCQLRQFKPLKLLSVLLFFKGLIFWTVFISSFSILCKLFVMLSLFIDFDIENYMWLIKYCCFSWQKYYTGDIIIATVYNYLSSSYIKRSFVLYNLWMPLWGLI